MLGIKTEAQAGQPAYFVPEYLQEHGVDIIPVPGAGGGLQLDGAVAGWRRLAPASPSFPGCLLSACMPLRPSPAHPTHPPTNPLPWHPAPAATGGGQPWWRSPGCLPSPASLPPSPPPGVLTLLPVYYPDAQEILGQAVVRDLKAITRRVDILDVFRRPQDLPQAREEGGPDGLLLGGSAAGCPAWTTPAACCRVGCLLDAPPGPPLLPCSAPPLPRPTLQRSHAH